VTAVNRLANEPSPYLRQHRDNPVDWFPWGPEAFEEARRRNVPILLSIGYSSCHWCHVMAHECFEDNDVAVVMNRLFVNIKVDREERPDVDALYMDAIQALTERGGWPLTAFLTPTGEPFYGGTYFPKPAFLQVMAAVDDAWHNKRADVENNVAALGDAIRRTASLEPHTDLPGTEVVTSAMKLLAESFDHQWGGFGSAPKFPPSMNIELLLRALIHSRDPGIAQVITTTLDAIASGGMYDHIGGGFCRYSVDERWLVPHFEKMLYDQALLLRTYVHAWQVLGHDRWQQVAGEVVDYVIRDLRDPEGGFCSAEDADSLAADGRVVEGAFYLWTPAEVRAALSADLAGHALEWYGITEDGNFEHSNIPSRLLQRGALARPEVVERARQGLLEARNLRPRPLRDDKVLTEWNAMFLSSLAEAAVAMRRNDWLELAIANAEFLVRELRAPNGRWLRSWQAGSGARHDALAADYAHLVDAFTRLGEASGQARWFRLAVECADDLLDRFWDPERGGLFTVPEDGEALVVRQKDIFDNATPSANSTAALALYRLAAITGESRYANHADRILMLLGKVVTSAPLAFAHLLCALALRNSGGSETAIVGDRPEMVAAVQRRFLPYNVLVWGEPFESPLWEGRRDGFAYVCRNYSCSAPADNVDALLERLAGR